MFHGCLAPQTTTGYRIEVVTVRKLEFETDAYAFGDKVRGAAAQWRGGGCGFGRQRHSSCLVA